MTDLFLCPYGRAGFVTQPERAGTARDAAVSMPLWSGGICHLKDLAERHELIKVSMPLWSGGICHVLSLLSGSTRKRGFLCPYGRAGFVTSGYGSVFDKLSRFLCPYGRAGFVTKDREEAQISGSRGFRSAQSWSFRLCPCV